MPPIEAATGIAASSPFRKVADGELAFDFEPDDEKEYRQ